MVKIIECISNYQGDAALIKAQVATQAELTTDADLDICAPGSIAWADDLSFFANKKNDGTWNIISLSLA